MNDKQQSLILCKDNSCRSQMVEAIINNCFKGGWMAFSAGSKPTRYVHLKANQLLKKIVIDHQGYSKNSDQFRDNDFKLIITVCDSAAEN